MAELAVRSRGRERRHRLERIAAQLEPDRAPYYVRPEECGWRRPERMPGWWWVPGPDVPKLWLPGDELPEPLGYSSTMAELVLRQLIDKSAAR